MTLDTAALRLLASAATRGPWVVVRQGEERWVDTMVNGPDPSDDMSCVAEIYRAHTSAPEENAAFIAASREAVPALCDEVDTLKARLDDYIELAETHNRCEATWAARVAELEAALRFYANDDNYSVCVSFADCVVEQDKGKTARAALGKP